MGSVFDGHSRLPSIGTEMNWTAIDGVVAICHVVFFYFCFWNVEHIHFWSFFILILHRPRGVEITIKINTLFLHMVRMYSFKLP